MSSRFFHHALTSLTIAAFSMVFSFTAAADDVFLTNGEVFEGVVVTELTDTRVEIRIAGGLMRLPRGQVARIERAVTPLETYEERVAALKAGPETRAEDWVALARFALQNELTLGARDAALTAARLNASAEGLEAVMQSLDYRRDQQSGRWLPYAEYMRAKGFVRYNNAWITRGEYEERRQAYRERREAEIAARRESERVIREAAREAALERREREVERRAAAPVLVYSLPAPVVTVQGGFYFQQVPIGTGGVGLSAVDNNLARIDRQHSGPRMNLLDRAPGSLIPGYLNTGRR